MCHIMCFSFIYLHFFRSAGLPGDRGMYNLMVKELQYSHAAKALYYTVCDSQSCEQSSTKGRKQL